MAKKITSLKAQKKNPNRVSIYLDGEYAFGLSRIVAGWLTVGQELNEVKIEELVDADRYEIAYQSALNFLKFRPRSEAEVRSNLLKRNNDIDTIDKVIARLRQVDLVDDRKFAQLWVSNRNEFSPRGLRALRYELRNKEIDDEIIDEVLNPLDEETIAYQAATRRARRYEHLEQQDFINKMSGFLSRKGFSVQTIIPVTRKVWEERTSTTIES